MLEVGQLQPSHYLHCHFLYITFRIEEAEHKGGLCIGQFVNGIKTLLNLFADNAIPLTVITLIDIQFAFGLVIGSETD